MKDKPTKIKCLQCGDIIESDGYGKWVSCSCGKCYIDETKYYCRIGGEPNKMEVEQNGVWVPLTIQTEKETKENNDIQNN